MNTPKEKRKVAGFDNLDWKKNIFYEVNDQRYPKDAVITDYTEYDRLDQNRDPKNFYKEYVGEELLTTLITYPIMKNFYHIQVIDLRFQVNPNNPEKLKLFEEHQNDPAKARLCNILITHGKIEMK